MRATGLISLIGIFFLISACNTKVYRLKCDSSVSKDLVEIIESKVYIEGDNPLFGEGHSKILVNIQNGKITGLKHKFGSTITNLSVQEGTGGGGSAPDRCDTEFINCVAGCGPAPLDGSTNPTRDQCLEKCDAQLQLCRCKGGGLAKSMSVIL
jgi:hypothetical protein